MKAKQKSWSNSWIACELIMHHGQDLKSVVFCGGGVVMVDFIHIFHGHLSCDDHKWVHLFNSIID